jgi:hypothetical protein
MGLNSAFIGLNGRLGGTQSRTERFGEKKKLFN